MWVIAQHGICWLSHAVSTWCFTSLCYNVKNKKKVYLEPYYGDKYKKNQNDVVDVLVVYKEWPVLWFFLKLICLLKTVIQLSICAVL